jgi:hypothetical protein
MVVGRAHHADGSRELSGTILPSATKNTSRGAAGTLSCGR